jgi:hypothetical protein
VEAWVIEVKPSLISRRAVVISTGDEVISRGDEVISTGEEVISVGHEEISVQHEEILIIRSPLDIPGAGIVMEHSAIEDVGARFDIIAARISCGHTPIALEHSFLVIR